GVCPTELCALGAGFPELARDDVELLTVSVDSTFVLRKWSDTEEFGFGLLSDFWPHGGVASLYGVFDADKGLANRGTFVIDKSGVGRSKWINRLLQASDIAQDQ